jgi:fructokinase
MDRIGIDLGGTKIEGIVLSANGLVAAGRRIASPREDYDGTVRAVAGLVAALEAETGTRGTVGVGTPGAISRATGVVKHSNSTWLNGRPLHLDLERAVGRPVRLANDANCFALSEACDGAAAGADVVFGVIVGTGTGGGIVIQQQVLTGPNAIAGEWGHNALPWPEPEERPGDPCYCGLRGCIETFLSGPGLSADHARVTGAARSSADIAALAAAGDAAADATLRRYEGRMARALASVINVLDPDVIVLGGGLSKLDRLYVNVPAQWARWIFSDRVDTRLVAPLHGDASGVRGAAWLWPPREAI